MNYRNKALATAVALSLNAAALALSVAALALSGAASAAEFSADTRQLGPQGEEMQGRMYVSGERVRTEMNHNGQDMVQIIDPVQGVQWVIMPAQSSYMEQRGQPKAPASGDEAGNPCKALPGATCRSLGEEPVSGRVTVKWEVSMADRQGRKQTALQWIDKERGIPLRSEAPGAQKMELRLVGQETLEGRAVEKWEMSIQQGGEAAQTSIQWFDPELKLAVREELPGGYVRELRNVRVGKQPEALFQPPTGFKKMTPPPQGQKNPQPGR